MALKLLDCQAIVKRSLKFKCQANRQINVWIKWTANARFANLLFSCSQSKGDVEETLTAIEIDEDTYEEVVRTTTRNIPMLFVRGDGIILISPPIRGSNWAT